MNVPQVLPRIIDRSIIIARAGQPPACIIYPGRFAGYRQVAQLLADVIEDCADARPLLISDVDLLPQRHSRLPDVYRRRPLILLGSLNTNRVIAPLYARHLCATDATYPGIGGYEVRVLVNPFGTQVNSLLLGGSDLEGVSNSLYRLIELLEGQRGELALPYTLDVKLAPDIARQFANWPFTRLDALPPDTGAELLNRIGMHAILYAWTGDFRHAQYSRDCLLKMNRLYPHSYGDWHYGIEKLVRALPWLVSSGLLSGGELHQTEERLLNNAIGSQNMWWRRRDGRPPLGHRHHGKGAFAFYLQARYLRDHARCNDAAQALCAQWCAECCAFLDALANARIDDQDDESTLNNLSTLIWYALGEERFELFESGNARLMAQRAIALHDNQGAGAGVEGYGEALPGAMYLHQEAGVIVAASAFYYQDSQLKWVRRRLPHLETPLRWDGWSVSPLFMHKFDTGDELPAEAPTRLIGLHRLPISPHQMEIMSNPPIHIEPRGHFVDAPETWQMQGGVGTTRLAEQRAFDKLVLRGGFESGDAYLLLQGYQGGYRWQGSMHAVNAIVRFAQHGHIWLIQNTDQQSYLHKNGVLVSNGFNQTLISPAAEWLAVDDFSTVALSATRVNECHYATWTRHLFWAKRGDGWFVVIDNIHIRQAGPYSFICTWRTPAFARIDDQQWVVKQGRHVFRLTWDGLSAIESEALGEQGAASPFVLHQTQSGDYAAGAQTTFCNLFYSRPAEDAQSLRLVSRSQCEALVLEHGRVLAWCAAVPGSNGAVFPDLIIQATGACVEADSAALAGATSFRINSAECQIDSDRPVGIYLHAPARRLLIQPDTPDSDGANVELRVGDRRQYLTLAADDPCVVELPDSLWRSVESALRDGLRLMSPDRPGPARTVMPQPDAAKAEWVFDGWQPVRERIRNLQVTARPEPLDGYADQLVDAVTPESRALAAQWPDAPCYEIDIDLGDGESSIDSIRLVGDSRAAPTLRVYRPLPQGIEVEISSDGFAQDRRRCDQPFSEETCIHRRFTRFEDHLQALRIPVQQSARAIRIRVPRADDGGPLVLHEVEVFGSRPASARVARLLAADLNADGEEEIIAANTAHELVVLSAKGVLLWRQTLPSPITDLATHDLDGNGRRQICVATLARNLIVYEADGAVRRTVALAAFDSRAREILLGQMQAVNASAVWRRDEHGRGCLALGCYGLILFLDADGNLLGHSYLDGSWVTDLLTVPGRAGEDLWARSRWCHGINIYRGQNDAEPSGAVLMLGGAAQPLFRDCLRVIPFTTGDRVAFDLIAHGGNRYVLAANETGFGVVSTTCQNWEWKTEGGTPLTACRAVGLDGADPQIVTGGADGFIAAYGLLDGRPRRRLYMDDPVVGIASDDNGQLLVGTRKRLVTLNKEWRPIASRAVSVDAVCPLRGRKVLVAQADGRLVKTDWPHVG